SEHERFHLTFHRVPNGAFRESTGGALRLVKPKVGGRAAEEAEHGRHPPFVVETEAADLVPHMGIAPREENVVRHPKHADLLIEVTEVRHFENLCFQIEGIPAIRAEETRSGDAR